MFPIYVELPVTQQDVADEFSRTQTPIVQTIDLAETTFARQANEVQEKPATRIADALDGEEHKALLATATQEGTDFAEQYMRTALNGIATKIEDPETRARFLDNDMPIKEYMEVLDYASSEDLLAVTATLYTLSLADGGVDNFVIDKIDNALHFFNIFEKKELTEAMLKQPKGESASGMIALILRSSDDLEELSTIVDGVGKSELMATEDARVIEYVAQAELTPMLQEIEFGAALPASASPEEVDARLEHLEKLFRKVIEIVEAHSEYRDTQVAKDFLHTAQDDLRNMAIERAEHVVTAPTAPVAPEMPAAPIAPAVPDSAELESNPDFQIEYLEALDTYQAELETYQDGLETYSDKLEAFEADWEKYEGELEEYHTEVATANRALREIANIYSLQADLEYTFGVNITYGTSDYLGNTVKDNDREHKRESRWTERDIGDIARVLEAIPEDHLLFSPLLREIQRVEELGRAFAARYVDGIVKVADSTIDSDYIIDAYDGENSLVMVLAHELGHSIQIGAGPSWFKTEDGKTVIEIGESRYDFDEWNELSGWEVIDRERWTGGGWGPIYLDGEMVETGVPIEHKGGNIVLVPMGWNILAKFDADAGFSHDPYSHASPWEDFAEAFCEYLFLPERLIEHAPEKFLHLELELRKFEGNERIENLLSEALANARQPNRTAPDGE